MKKFIILISIVFASNCHADFKIGNISISDIWARPTYGKSLNTAVYMNIRNQGSVDYMNKIKTNIARIADLHKTVTEQGISQMVHINRLALPVGVDVKLQPKSLHIMLIGLKKPLKSGDKFNITLFFQNAGQITVNVPVR